MPNAKVVLDLHRDEAIEPYPTSVDTLPMGSRRLKPLKARLLAAAVAMSVMAFLIYKCAQYLEGQSLPKGSYRRLSNQPQECRGNIVRRGFGTPAGQGSQDEPFHAPFSGLSRASRIVRREDRPPPEYRDPPPYGAFQPQWNGQRGRRRGPHDRRRERRIQSTGGELGRYRDSGEQEGYMSAGEEGMSRPIQRNTGPPVDVDGERFREPHRQGVAGEAEVEGISRQTPRQAGVREGGGQGWPPQGPYGQGDGGEAGDSGRPARERQRRPPPYVPPANREAREDRGRRPVRLPGAPPPYQEHPPVPYGDYANDPPPPYSLRDPYADERRRRSRSEPRRPQPAPRRDELVYPFPLIDDQQALYDLDQMMQFIRNLRHQHRENRHGWFTVIFRGVVFEFRIWENKKATGWPNGANLRDIGVDLQSRMIELVWGFQKDPDTGYAKERIKLVTEVNGTVQGDVAVEIQARRLTAGHGNY